MRPGYLGYLFIILTVVPGGGTQRKGHTDKCVNVGFKEVVVNQQLSEGPRFVKGLTIPK